jgi:hypothetical protein
MSESETTPLYCTYDAVIKALEAERATLLVRFREIEAELGDKRLKCVVMCAALNDPTKKAELQTVLGANGLLA